MLTLKTYKTHWKRIIIITAFIILTFLSLEVGALAEANFRAVIAGDELARFIFIHSRVPRTLAVILAAAGLSVAGLIMQSISRNKFMSPTTAGTTDAAALGLLVSFVFLRHRSSYVQAVFSFVFALVGTVIFTTVISRL